MDIELDGRVGGWLLLGPAQQPSPLQVTTVLVCSRVGDVEALGEFGDLELLLLGGKPQDIELSVVR
jgi:hypothetical protein